MSIFFSARFERIREIIQGLKLPWPVWIVIGVAIFGGLMSVVYGG